MSRQVIFFNGQFFAADEALLESLSPGVLQARGVFETLRVEDGRILDFERHIRRMRSGLRTLGIAAPLSGSDIKMAVRLLAQKNHLKEARARVMVWKTRGRPRIAVVVQPLGKFPRRGFRGMISCAVHERPAPNHVKSLDYVLFRQAFSEARRQGSDEAILVNKAGDVVEGSRTNIFFVKDRCLVTPPLSRGPLKGLTRQTVIELARELKIPCRQKRFPAEALFSAEEVFVTNSLIGVTPLTALEGREIAGAREGALTQRLSKMYRDFVGRNLPSA